MLFTEKFQVTDIEHPYRISGVKYWFSYQSDS